MRSVVLILLLGCELSAAADVAQPAAEPAIAPMREVWVAARRLRKGSAVRCDDLKLRQRPASCEREAGPFAGHSERAQCAERDLAFVGAAALPRPMCSEDGKVVALRELGAGDVVRNADVGAARDVWAGEPVSLSVTSNAVRITTRAVALADAVAGDRIDVRMARGGRVLSAIVTGPGTAQLAQAAP